MTTRFDSALKWYTGKSLEGATKALAMVAEAEVLGYWPSGYSRKVTALLNKMNVAKKFAMKNEIPSNRPWDAPPLRGLLESVKDPASKHYTGNGWFLNHNMMFGGFSAAPEGLTLAKSLERFCENDAERAALATAKSWCEDFAPIAEVVEKLDATRPKPVLLMKTLSPTVLGNVGAAMGIKLDTLTIPEMEWKKVEALTPKGERYWTWEVNILWPEGTKHNTSRYASGDHCHACGHRISNPFNWAPLLADSEGGKKSLWVGKDCARNLFGCDVKGEVEWRKDLEAARAAR